MAKRMIDQSFTRKSWIRKLSAAKRLFIVYLFCECDNGGIIDLDIEAAEFWLGEKIGNPLEFLPAGFLIPLGADRFFIPEYVETQHPNLKTSNNNITAQAREILKKEGLLNSENEIVIPAEVVQDLRKISANVAHLSISNSKSNSKSKSKSKSKEENGDFEKFLAEFNRITQRSYRGTDTARKHFNARIADKYTPEQMITAIVNCKMDRYHQENPNYLTPDFILRPAILEKYLNAVPVNNTEPGGRVVSMVETQRRVEDYFESKKQKEN